MKQPSSSSAALPSSAPPPSSSPSPLSSLSSSTAPSAREWRRDVLRVEIRSAWGVGGMYPFVVACFDNDLHNELHKTPAVLGGQLAVWNDTFIINLATHLTSTPTTPTSLKTPARTKSSQGERTVHAQMRRVRKPTYLTFFVFDTGKPGIPNLGSAGVLLKTVRKGGVASGSFPVVHGTGSLYITVRSENAAAPPSSSPSPSPSPSPLPNPSPSPLSFSSSPARASSIPPRLATTEASVPSWPTSTSKSATPTASPFHLSYSKPSDNDVANMTTSTSTTTATTTTMFPSPSPSSSPRGRTATATDQTEQCMSEISPDERDEGEDNDRTGVIENLESLSFSHEAEDGTTTTTPVQSERSLLYSDPESDPDEQDFDHIMLDDGRLLKQFYDF